MMVDITPETCETCNYPPRKMCPSCHGSGKVYPPETVDRIGESMRSILSQVVSIELEPSQFVILMDELAVAVLDALNNETPKHLRKGAGPVVGPAELDALNEP